MSAATVTPVPAQAPKARIDARVILTMGNKGGTGKTDFAVAMADYLDSIEVPHTRLDLDVEVKARGSFSHFYPDAKKINIHTPEGLNQVIDVIEGGPPIVVADMGASAGNVTLAWFNRMHRDVTETLGVAFTACGMITPTPASIEGVLSWANVLQNRVQYLIVKNAITDPASFEYWEELEQAETFRQVFQPAEITMPYRLPRIEAAAQQYGLTLSKIAKRQTNIPELQGPTAALAANSDRRHMFAEFDRVKDLLLL